MSNAQIVDLFVILLWLTMTILIFLAAFKKLPSKGQEAFDTVNSFKPTTLKISGFILLIYVVLSSIELVK